MCNYINSENINCIEFDNECFAIRRFFSIKFWLNKQAMSCNTSNMHCVNFTSTKKMTIVEVKPYIGQEIAT